MNTSSKSAVKRSVIYERCLPESVTICVNPWLQTSFSSVCSVAKTFFAKQTQFSILQNPPNFFIHKLITVNG